MYAILQQSGRQFRVSPGDRLVVDRLDAEVGTVVALAPVVLVQDDGGTRVGTPVIEGVRVSAMVVSHRKGAKLRVFKYKPKKHYRRTHGHRSLLTELRVEAVLAAGEALPEVAPAATPEADEAKPAKKAKAPATKGRGKVAAAAVEEAETTNVAETAGTAVTTEAAEAETEAPKRPARTRTRKPAKPKAEAEADTTDTATPAADGEAETEG